MNFSHLLNAKNNCAKTNIEYLSNVKNWLKYNTYNCFDYDNLYDLYCNKNNKTISIVMPTLNEEGTVGFIIEKIFDEINKEYQIIDELILIDGGSTDNTIEIVKI